MAAGAILQSLLRPSDGRAQQLDKEEASRPLLFEGRAPTVFCLHGFTGVPQDVRLPCEVARSLGLGAQAPLLPGHGTCPADLSSLRFRDWVNGVRPQLSEARKRGPVILVGHSLGALVATELALEVPGDVLGLVLIASAFYLRRPHPDSSLAMAARLRLPDAFIPKSGPDLLDEEAKRTHVCYMEQPLHAAISMREAGVRLRGELFRIHRPTLFLHGGGDQVTPASGAEKAAACVGCADTRLIVYPRSHHILTRDVDRERVAEDLRHFFQRLSST